MSTLPDLVYHLSDTARLPWILRLGCLIPGANRIGDYPDPDFLWANTDARGDATASADRGKHYRSGKVRHVRFALPRSMFIPWADVPAQFPAWTPYHVRRLEAVAAQKGVSPTTWWCRAEPFPLTNCNEIATRSYHRNHWRPLDPKSEVVEATDGRKLWLVMEIEGQTFASTKLVGPHGQDAYEVRAGSVGWGRAA